MNPQIREGDNKHPVAVRHEWHQQLCQRKERQAMLLLMVVRARDPPTPSRHTGQCERSS